MKFITLVTALVAAIPAAFGALTINTPASVVECEPTQFNWSGGTSPYYLTLVPAGQPSATAIKQFPQQSGTSYTWNVDLASGTSFTIALKDSTGTTAYSDIVTVQAGTSSSCVNNSVQETGTGGSGAASTPASGSTTAAAGSTVAAATGTTSHSSSGSATSTSTASSSSSTHSSGAGRLSVSSAFGVAGVMGLVGAALF